MVLKVEGKSFEETKPILGSNEKPEKDDIDLKVQDTYKHITSPMISDPVKVDNPEVALELFFTTVKVQDIPLAKQCLEITNRQLNKYNALSILQQISSYNMTGTIVGQIQDLAPSAPPITDKDNHPNEDWVQDLTDNLRNNCLLEIDKNADFILKQKDFFNLCYEDVRTITTRDTLGVSSEMVVYIAVMNWAMEECLRRKLPVKVHLRAVLKDLAHAPRYGLMSKKEFLCRTIDGIKGPDRSGVLDENEIEEILNYIKKKGKNSPVRELPFKQSLPRRVSNEKSRAFHSGVSGDSICTSNSKCDKFVINFLTCWTAVFD